jgi:hypothetical protein
MGSSTLDVTSGRSASEDEITAEVPTSPAYREGTSLWVWDDQGRFGFPRIGVEAVGASWTEAFNSALCMAQPGGRLLLVNDDFSPQSVLDDQGRPRVLGAGPLRFECIEPFVRWRMEFDGPTKAIDVREFLALGKHRLTSGDAPELPLRLQLEATSVAPPWFQNTYDPDGYHVVGENRFEQLCSVAGTVELEGQSTQFTGGALRIHRKGGNRNNYGEFYGHVWATTSFPSGRAFGLMHYRPGPDGVLKYREAWVLDSGKIVPAKVERTPWLAGTIPAGEDVSFVLRTQEREIRIGGEIAFSSFRPPRPIGDGTTFPLLHSSIARYSWDGEVAYGMMERSARL